MPARKPIIPILGAGALALIGLAALALQRDVPTQINYYPETGHAVRQPILGYFLEKGGPDLFGYPLADAYTTADDILVQPFQNAQLQLTVEGIELAPIGVALQLGEPGNYPVGEAFGSFYEMHGGVAFFGLPLGPAHLENDILVQDFERARLVRDGVGNIRLANLGSIYFAAFPPPGQGEQAAFHLHGTPMPPRSIRPSLSIEHPTISEGEYQTVYLIVEDGEGHPIAGVQALATLRYNNGTAEVTLPETDERGFASATFAAPPAAPGSRVMVEVHALVGETFLTAQTTYFQWW